MQVKVRVYFFLVLVFAILSLSPFGHCDSGNVASANQPFYKDLAPTFYYFVAAAALLVGGWLGWRRFYLFREREQSVLLSFRIRHMKVQGVFHVFVEIDAENIGKVLINGKKLRGKSPAHLSQQSGWASNTRKVWAAYRRRSGRFICP